jgi:hypothetical protein
MEQLSRAVRLLRTGGEGDRDDQDERRPDARLLQQGLPQRLGGEAADQVPAPVRRAAGSRLAEF